MKDMFQVQNDHWRVESEPGDATHYSYRVHIDRTDAANPKYNFEAVNSTFRYPKHVYQNSGLAALEPDSKIPLSIATEFNCNPWTVLECCRTIQDIVNELA